MKIWEPEFLKKKKKTSGTLLSRAEDLEVSKKEAI